MVSAMINSSLKNRLIVLAAVLVLLVWGGWTAKNAPLDVFPDLTSPVVTLVTEAPGLAPQEVERLVTLPIESAMNAASGVRRVRSNTGVGIAVVNIDFEWGTDIYQARQIVAEKLQVVTANLPPDIPLPVMAPISSIMGEIMFIALTSDRHGAMELKTTADWVVRRRLLAVPGVAEVIPNGGETKQFQVIVSPDRLAAYGIGVGELVKRVQQASAKVSAGFMTENQQEYLIQGIGQLRAIEDLEQVLVSDDTDLPVLLKDVADVVIGPAPARGTAAYNQTPSVVLGIQKQPNVNTLELTQNLDRVMQDMQASLPEGMRIETNVFRQADFIDTAIDNLVIAIRDGAILVVAIMFVFLMSARATGIALLAIPISVLSAVLVIYWLGGSLNTMTLGGLAIAMGALVDDAIIVVENIVRRLRDNNQKPLTDRISAFKVISQSTREIQTSIVFATLIIMLVFLPLFFLDGVEGRLMAPLGLAYIVAILVSLLVALTVTPVLALYLLPYSGAVLNQRHDSKLITGLKKGYQPLLSFALNHSRWVLATALVLVLLVLSSFFSMGRGFLPPFNEGSLTVSVVSLPGTSLETSDQLGSQVEKILLNEPEVVATARRTGRAELDPHAQEVFASEIEVTLQMQQRSREAFLASLRQDFSQVPGANIVIGQPISHRIDHMLSGTRANIAIKIFGEDLVELRRIAADVEQRVKQIPGAVDVAAEQQSEIPQVSVQFDRLALADYGLSLAQAAQLIEVAFGNLRVNQLIEGQARFDVVLKFDDEHKASIDAIKNTLIQLDNGVLMPIAAIAEVQKTRGPNTISRENVQRKIVVMANVAERDLMSVVNDIQADLTELALPSGYHFEYGGQFESAQSATLRLSLLSALVIVGMFLILITAFNSVRDASLIMINLPLSLIGGVAAIWFTDGVLTLASIIGFIALFGIATRNGVILIDHIRRLEQQGLALRQAIEQGSNERLIPILMTAFATALALIPLAMAAGEPGSELQAPMAMVILFGLISSTLLNMLVVPAALYLLTHTAPEQHCHKHD
ncbi:MAG: efflux RND transporter permease subunit [Hydrogenovibrio sp.]|uniref:efflux RND transporter permease subunit n=1 Tax=Hydrogenovibrio sp. TaxID=2065821 RepID=UPI0028704A47|nr:efflux RND transporter permease subunit [Hydrogenovibrio sp.]MDR9499873.1 efflux RND transporter permease subunit [Hydrogenovibrio sp.]